MHSIINWTFQKYYTKFCDPDVFRFHAQWTHGFLSTYIYPLHHLSWSESVSFDVLFIRCVDIKPLEAQWGSQPS